MKLIIRKSIRTSGLTMDCGSIAAGGYAHHATQSRELPSRGTGDSNNARDTTTSSVA